MSHSISVVNNGADNPEYFEEYDLSQKNTSAEGTLLEFGANNCIACRQMKKVLAELKITYSTQLDIEFINISQKEGLATGRKFGMVMIPMQVLLDKNGSVVFKHVGYISESELGHQINMKILSK